MSLASITLQCFLIPGGDERYERVDQQSCSLLLHILHVLPVGSGHLAGEALQTLTSVQSFIDPFSRFYISESISNRRSLSSKTFTATIVIVIVKHHVDVICSKFQPTLCRSVVNIPELFLFLFTSLTFQFKYIF